MPYSRELIHRDSIHLPAFNLLGRRNAQFERAPPLGPGGHNISAPFNFHRRATLLLHDGNLFGKD